MSSDYVIMGRVCAYEEGKGKSDERMEWRSDIFLVLARDILKSSAGGKCAVWALRDRL